MPRSRRMLGVAWLAAAITLVLSANASAGNGTPCSGDIDPGFDVYRNGDITVSGVTYGAYRLGARWTASQFEYQVAVDDVRTDGLPPYVYWKAHAGDGTQHRTTELHNFQTAVQGWECHTGSLSTGNTFLRFELWGSPDNAPRVPEVNLLSIENNVEPPPPPVEADEGGFTAPDCTHDPTSQPGGPELPGHPVDDNCDELREPFPLVAALVRHAFARSRNRGSATRTRVSVLTVARLPAGGRVTLTCQPPRRPRAARGSCPFTRKELVVSTPTDELKLAPLFKRRRLALRTLIQVTINAPASNGKVLTYRIARARTIRPKLTCVTPDQTPTPCS